MVGGGLEQRSGPVAVVGDQTGARSGASDGGVGVQLDLGHVAVAGRAGEGAGVGSAQEDV